MRSRDDLATYLPHFSKSQVLVIGDIMLDRYVWGRVDRISPEAPIPVLRVERTAAMLGGAGNVGEAEQGDGGDAAQQALHRNRFHRNRFHGALLAQRKPMLAVVSRPSSEDSIATRISTA